MNEAEKRVADRQGGGYEPPVETKPRGGPVPAWRQQDEPPPVSSRSS